MGLNESKGDGDFDEISNFEQTVKRTLSDRFVRQTIFSKQIAQSSLFHR